MGNVKRIYVEKKADFAVKASELKEDLKNYLGLNSVEEVRVFIRYDVENLSEEIYNEKTLSIYDNYFNYGFCYGCFMFLRKQQYI